ncbi:MAG: transcriptional regulator [Acidimicrobiia bacterium]|nr:transcriptional regulator [Acidimicrobiia bacterium]
MTLTRRQNPIADCPLTAASAVFGGKWKLIVIYWLAESPRQFGELRRLMEGVSQKVLTEQLRQLMADGVVAREPTGQIPSPVHYSLTAYGNSLVPIVETIRLWGREHIERIEGG